MIFPELQNKRFSEIDLDREARRWIAERGTEQENPLLDPSTCQAFVDECHRRLRVDYSYGGWMESRSTLWRGSYLDVDETYIHLGVDFNVPAGTGVSVTNPSVVLRIDNDYPEAYGWGNRVIVHDPRSDLIIVFAHLGTPINGSVGDVLTPGSIFGRVGNPTVNGGWFPHLHLQAIKHDHYQTLLKNDLRDLDGYGRAEDIELLSSNFPNPMAHAGMFA